MTTPSEHSTGPRPIPNAVTNSAGMGSPANAITVNLSKVAGATFEDLLEAVVAAHTGGREWRAHAWSPGVGLGNLHRVINPRFPLPSWRIVASLLEQLSVPMVHYADFQSAYERAKLYRPWSEAMHIKSGDHEPTTYVINHHGGSLNLYPERRPARRERREEDPVIPDAKGYALKPDPFGADTLAGLEDRARAYWHWAGRPSSRKIARRARGIFSHATIAKIVFDKPNKPPLKMDYLIGMIRGCGGDQAEQERWVTAWRILDEAEREGHGATAVYERMRAASEALGESGPDGTLP
ncbi:MAG: hypothetical protein ACJ72W_00095, partial [Actinoallomurus sp.]